MIDNAKCGMMDDFCEQTDDFEKTLIIASRRVIIVNRRGMIASLLTSDGVHLDVGREEERLDGLLAPPDPLVVGGALPLPVDLVLYTVLYCTVLHWHCTVMYLLILWNIMSAFSKYPEE